MWEDLAEVRTLAVADEWLGKGVGHAIIERIEADALQLGLSRLFCLTFEVEFFSRHGFAPIADDIVAPEIFAELARSPDEGVAEFLDISRVKPNTLGNTRMLKRLGYGATPAEGRRRGGTRRAGTGARWHPATTVGSCRPSKIRWGRNQAASIGDAGLWWVSAFSR
jgi:GNAT superfamily N-acetyltransferase